MKLLGKNGGTLPGNIALKLNRNILKYFNISGNVIAITGTNGKTSTTNLIGNILSNCGSVVSNREGNNINTGIVSLLVKNSDLSGNINCDYLVLEVDEHYVPVVFRDLKLDSFVVLNFFRDQLDRTGEVETLIQKIDNFLDGFTGNLILNSDDPNVSRLGFDRDKCKVYYYGVEKFNGATSNMHDRGEGKYCPFCSAKLEYDYYQYSHVGKFKCPKCNFGSNDINSFVYDIDLVSGNFKYNDKIFETRYNTIYNMYNISAAFMLSSLYNVSSDYLFDSVKNFELNNGRLETVLVNDCLSILNLVKNPTGANVTINYMNQDNEHKEMLFVLNDNVADGRDVSWIWDINFSILNNVDRIITSGTRCYDMAVRIKNSGFDFCNIEVCPDINDAVSNLYKNSGKKYIIFNYTATTDTRRAVLNYKGDKNGL
jgi:UDP-N-acetylmuramyl tripeptide synthase